MTVPTLDTPRLAPLERGRGDGTTRLARRTQRGQGGRRALVLALIAVAVAAGVTAAAVFASLVRSDATVGVEDRFGPAAALHTVYVHTQSETTLTDEQRAWLEAHPLAPGAAEYFTDEQDVVLLDVPTLLSDLGAGPDDVLRFGVSPELQQHGPDGLGVTDMDVTHPLAGDTFAVTGPGRTLTGDEGLLSPSLLDRLGASVGDVVTVAGVGRVEVVGTATRAWRRSQEVAVIAPGRAVPGTFSELQTRIADPSTAGLLNTALEEERRSAEDAEMDDSGPWVEAGYVDMRSTYLAVTAGNASIATLAGTGITGLATTFAIAVAACAFAVGVRRRIRELGMLSAVGASPAQVRRLLRREGLVIGVLGAGLGGLIGVTLAVVGHPVLEAVVDREMALLLPPLGMLLPVLLGASGALLAAIWPARTAARVPVVSALAGRVPLGKVPWWLPVGGAIAAVAGVAMLFTLFAENGPGEDTSDLLLLLGGTALATFGTATLGIPVVALGGRIADRLPLLGRLALRDAARQRSRSGAAIAALVPVLALPVAGLTVWANSPYGTELDDGTASAYVTPAPAPLVSVAGPWVHGRSVPPAPAVLDVIDEALPTTGERVEMTHLGTPQGLSGAYATWDVVTPSRVTGGGGSGTTEERVIAGQLVLATPALIDALGMPDDAVVDGQLTVLTGALWGRLPDELTSLPLVDDRLTVATDGRTVSLSETFAQLRIRRDTTVVGRGAPDLLITASTADDLGLVEVGSSTLVPLTETPRRAAIDALWFSDVLGQSNLEASPRPEWWQGTTGRVLLGIVATLLLALGVSVVAGMTAALAATESDGDLRKAVALGAAPRLRRRFHGVQAWWHTVIAALLACLLGTAVAAAVLHTSTNLATEFTPQWLPMLAWVLALPVVVGLVIASVLRSSPVTAPRRRMA